MRSLACRGWRVRASQGTVRGLRHFAETPPGETFLALIEHVLNGAQFGPLRIERVLDEDWVTLSQGKRGPIKAGRFLVHGSHDRSRVPRRLLAIEIDAGQASARRITQAHEAASSPSTIC